MAKDSSPPVVWQCQIASLESIPLTIASYDLFFPGFVCAKYVLLLHGVQIEPVKSIVSCGRREEWL